jgi:hypothetical protein
MKILTKRKQKHFLSYYQQTNKRIENRFFDKKKRAEVKKKNELWSTSATGRMEKKDKERKAEEDKQADI